MSDVDDPGDADLPDEAIRDRRQVGDDDIEESLHEALNDLEQMLERHEGPRTASGGGEGRDEDGEPFTIPLLDEVVIPGTAVPAARQPASRAGEDAMPIDDEPALRRRLATRLASEIEVIVQDRIEAAMEAARAQITQQVRNHIDIMLPEIVDEFIRINRPDDD